MSALSLQLRSVNLFLGTLPSQTEASPRSQWENPPGVLGSHPGSLPRAAGAGLHAGRLSQISDCLA